MLDRAQTELTGDGLKLNSKRLTQAEVALVRAGFGGGVHAVLRNFVDAARGRLLVQAEKMIERPGALADGESPSMAFVT